MADRMASSANTVSANFPQRIFMRQERSNALEQCSLTGGRHNSFAISVFLIFPASSRDKPLTRSVIYELEAIAEPQPNVLNLTSEMIPFSLTRICNFITSPQLVKQKTKRGKLLAIMEHALHGQLTQVHQRVLYQRQSRSLEVNQPIRTNIVISGQKIIR